MYTEIDEHTTQQPRGQQRQADHVNASRFIALKEPCYSPVIAITALRFTSCINALSITVKSGHCPFPFRGHAGHCERQSEYDQTYMDILVHPC